MLHVSIHSLVLFAVICQDEILELNLHLDPLLVGERGPDVMRLSDGGLVWFQDHLGTVIVHVQSSEDQDEPGESLEVQQSTEHLLFTQKKQVRSSHKSFIFKFVATQVCTSTETKSKAGLTV